MAGAFSPGVVVGHGHDLVVCALSETRIAVGFIAAIFVRFVAFPAADDLGLLPAALWQSPTAEPTGDGLPWQSPTAEPYGSE